MRLGKIIKVVTWMAAAVAFLLVIMLDMDSKWLVIVAASAFSVAFSLEAAMLFRKGAMQRRFRDLREFSAHQRYTVADLKSAMASDGMLNGLSMQVSLGGTAEAGAESGEKLKKAPLSGRECLAYRIEAELVEGIWQQAGQTFTIDSYWDNVAVQDATGSVSIRGPGLLDTSGVTEKLLTLTNMKKAYPELAESLKGALGILNDKDSKNARVLLRETLLAPEEKVVAYGIADSGKRGLAISGSDELDDKESLFIRSERKPASSRLRKKLPQAVFMTVLALASLSLALGLAAAILFKPGAPLDLAETGRMIVKPEGRNFRLRFGEQYWDFNAKETKESVELYQGEELFTAVKTDVFALQRIASQAVTLRNGDAGYPRWDGQQWMLTLGSAPPVGAPAVEPTGAQANAQPSSVNSGKLYIRNMTADTFTLRVLAPDRAVAVATVWTFHPLEGADNPIGQWLSWENKAVPVKGADFVELITKTGAKRILNVGTSAAWQEGKGSWLLEAVPELLAGTAPIYVKNVGSKLARVQIIGADGNTMYGDSPWAFEPKEGADKSLGLSLLSQDKDVSVSGREEFRVEYIEFITVAEEPIKELAKREDGAWTLYAGKFFTD